MIKPCERCGATPTPHRTSEGEWTVKMNDYCANCSRDLCPACMAQGCCGHVPAESGMDADFPAEDE